MLGFFPAWTRLWRALLDSMSAHTGRLSTDGRSLAQRTCLGRGGKEGGWASDMCLLWGTSSVIAGLPCRRPLSSASSASSGLLQGWKPFVWSPRKQCSFKRRSAVRGEAHTPECETVPFIKKTLLWKNVRTKQCVYSDIIGVHSGIRQVSCLVTSDTVYRSATKPQTTP